MPVPRTVLPGGQAEPAALPLHLGLGRLAPAKPARFGKRSLVSGCGPSPKRNPHGPLVCLVKSRSSRRHSIPQRQSAQMVSPTWAAAVVDCVATLDGWLGRSATPQPASRSNTAKQTARQQCPPPIARLASKWDRVKLHLAQNPLPHLLRRPSRPGRLRKHIGADAAQCLAHKMMPSLQKQCSHRRHPTFFMVDVSGGSCMAPSPTLERLARTPFFFPPRPKNRRLARYQPRNRRSQTTELHQAIHQDRHDPLVEDHHRLPDRHSRSKPSEGLHGRTCSSTMFWRDGL